MADRPFEHEKVESAFANPDMHWHEGWMDAFKTVKESYNRESTISLALPLTSAVLFNRDPGGDAHDAAYAHVVAG